MGISQRTRDGRSVAYSWDEDAREWLVTFTDCDYEPRSVLYHFEDLNGVDRSADRFLERYWTPDKMAPAARREVFVWDVRNAVAS